MREFLIVARDYTFPTILDRVMSSVSAHHASAVSSPTLKSSWNVSNLETSFSHSACMTETICETLRFVSFRFYFLQPTIWPTKMCTTIVIQRSNCFQPIIRRAVLISENLRHAARITLDWMSVILVFLWNSIQNPAGLQSISIFLSFPMTCLGICRVRSSRTLKEIREIWWVLLWYSGGHTRLTWYFLGNLVDFMRRSNRRR